MAALLTVEHLEVNFPTADGTVHAVRDVSFTVDAGETVGIVGESGSGKSVTALTLIGLAGASRVSGSAVFNGTELVGATPRVLRKLRGAAIGMVFQDPLSSLHPHYRVGRQIEEAIHAHEHVSRGVARQRAVELLDLVAIPHAAERASAYPHELSGGMRQRVGIAMALALRPQLLIADEPTTALDATVQAQIIQLLGRLQSELGMALIMITHDLGIIARIASRVVVMYAGRVAERAPRHELFATPHHPYTAGLIRAIPAATPRGERLTPIPGQPPSLISPPRGCAFAPRCAYVMPDCTTRQPPEVAIGSDPRHSSACILPPQITGTDVRADEARTASSKRATEHAVGDV